MKVSDPISRRNGVEELFLPFLNYGLSLGGKVLLLPEVKLLSHSSADLARHCFEL